jgi:hypothetical protein
MLITKPNSITRLGILLYMNQWINYLITPNGFEAYLYFYNITNLYLLT